MDFYKVIEERQSIRSYDKDRKVEQNKLMRILNAGRLSPSAANKQPWKFILVSSSKMLEKVKQCYNKPWFHNAPHILIIKGKKSEAWQRSYDGYNSIETDLAIAMDHMILAAENEGIATCWIANFNPDLLKLSLNLSEDEIVFTITSPGYPEKNFKKQQNKIRKSPDEIFEFI